MEKLSKSLFRISWNWRKLANICWVSVKAGAKMPKRLKIIMLQLMMPVVAILFAVILSSILINSD